MPSRSCPDPALGQSGLWTLDLRLLDLAVRIESPDEAFVLALSACFLPPSGAEHVSDGGRALTLHIGPLPPPSDGRFLTGRDLRSSSPTFPLPCVVRTPLDLCSSLNQWAAVNTRCYYVFHAGAVARGNKAVLLPAASGSGKSTTTAGLLRRGFQLLSDEIGAIELERGRVVGYPRALSLREDVLGLLGLGPEVGVAFPPCTGRLVQPEDLGSSRAPAPADLALVVLPRYSPGARTRIERLRSGAALVALMQSSCSQPAHKAAGLDRVLALVRRVPCYELTFSDLGEALARLEATFDRHAGEER
jgi:hypothetical protein